MRRYDVRRVASVARDISGIRKHMIRSYLEFGDTQAIAAERAASRIRDAFDYMLTFATNPHRGTVHPELRGGVRHVTERKFVYYFEVDEPAAEVTILAVFFGGEEHWGQITERLRH